MQVAVEMGGEVAGMTSYTNSTDYRNINYNETYCLHRLPCGYCKILMQMCPLLELGGYTMTWEEYSKEDKG